MRTDIYTQSLRSASQCDNPTPKAAVHERLLISAGVLLYCLAQGIVMTAWSAVVFALSSGLTQSASTRYSLVHSAAVISATYMVCMVYLNTQTHSRHGLPGRFGVDTISTLFAGLAVALLLRYRRWAAPLPRGVDLGILISNDSAYGSAAQNPAKISPWI